jgi:isoprene-epoxide---glutathione S-transferase
MLKVFFYNNPGWGVPCISPFVTKTMYYLKMAAIPFVTERQNLQTLQADAPYGKLPYIIDSDGNKVADSTEIIRYLKRTYGDPLDATATINERCVMHAWNRLIDEHLYWAAGVESRWDDDENFDLYRPCLAGINPVPPEVNAMLDHYRGLMRQELVGQGLGRMPAESIYDRGVQDLDAIVGFLGDRQFFMGNEPRSIDATLTSMLKHIMYVPFKFAVKDHALSQKTLVSYCQRMVDRFALERLADIA